MMLTLDGVYCGGGRVGTDIVDYDYQYGPGNSCPHAWGD